MSNVRIKTILNFPGFLFQKELEGNQQRVSVFSVCCPQGAVQVNYIAQKMPKVEELVQN